MSVSDSGHSIDLEILVGTDGRGFLNRSPVGPAWLGIVEPLVAELTNEGGISVGDALGNLRASDATTSLDHLLANLVVSLSGGLLLHEIVPHGVSGTDNLDFVDEVRVESGGSNTNPVHLTHENFVSEQPGSPKTAVGVGEVVASLSGHIGKFTEDGLSGVVLLLDIVEMLSVLLDIVVTDHVSEKLEGVVVFVVDGGSVIEDTNVGVVHLVVTHHKQRGSVDALV